MSHIVTYRACKQSQVLFDRLAALLRQRGVETSRLYSSAGFGVRTECRGKTLALVALTGTGEEVLAGFSVLQGAINTCPVGILFDHAGYTRCIGVRKFDFQRVRFGVRLGCGEFDTAKVECLAARGEKPILRISQTDWEDSDLTEVVEKAHAVATSKSRMIFS